MEAKFLKAQASTKGHHAVGTFIYLQKQERNYLQAKLKNPLGSLRTETDRKVSI